MPYDTTYAEAGTHPEFLHPKIRGASPISLERGTGQHVYRFNFGARPGTIRNRRRP